MGHEVLTCGMRPHLEYVIEQSVIHLDELLRRLSNQFTPDCILWLDNSGPICVLGFEDCQIPCAFYSVDTHHHHVRHAAIAGCFDHIFVAQKDFLPNFDEYGTPASWLPLWASEYYEPSTEKKYPVAFVGTLNPKLNPARVEFFSRLQELIPITVLEGHFPSIFPHAEIVLNQTVKGDLNFRVFESLMSGSLLLTEHTGNGLFDLFEEGKHLVTYTPRDPHDAAEKVSSLLATPNRIREIGAAGRAEVLSHHTARPRAEVVVEVLQRLSKRPADPRRHLGTMMNLVAISLASEQGALVLSERSSVLALESAKRSLHEGSPLSDLFVAQVVRTCLRHDIKFRDSLGARVLAQYAEAYPQLPVFGLLQMRALLNAGDIAAAREISRRVVPLASPDEAFSTAERAANLFIEQIPGIATS